MPTSADGVLTAEFDPVRNLVELRTNGAAWSVVPVTVSVDRIVDGVRTPVRGAERRPVAGGVLLWTDNEAPMDAQVSYEARGYDADGNPVSSETITNWMTDPRATTASRWNSTAGTGGAVTESMVTGATDGPVLPDGTQVSTYARYTWNSGLTAASDIYMGHVVDGASPIFPTVDQGEPIVGAIYIRPSIGLSAAPRIDKQLDGANLADQDVASPQAVPAGTWVRLAGSVLTDVAFNQAGARARVLGTTAVVPGTTIDVTCGLVVAGAVIVDHFDGDTVDSALYVHDWTDAPNASPSIRNSLRATVTVSTSGSDWGQWVKIPGDPARTQRVSLSVVGDEVEDAIGGAYLIPSGQNGEPGSSLSQTGGMGPLRTQVVLQTDTPAALSALRAAVRSAPAQTLLLQTGEPAELPPGYYRVTGMSKGNLRVTTDVYPKRLVTLTVEAAQVPAGPATGAFGPTWDDVIQAFPTWQALKDSGLTWLQLATGEGWWGG